MDFIHYSMDFIHYSMDFIHYTNSMDFIHYRPISILQFVIYNHTIRFVTKHNILNKYQFGFRKDHSTHHTIITLVDKITKTLENGGTLWECSGPPKSIRCSQSWYSTS